LKLQSQNQFLRSIHYAISLGGDTDTIASMAGSISGAHLGFEAIPQEMLRHCDCEASDKILKVADELYGVSAK
jgi:poly(ADP-ribose) glycohydrolase ARH3